MRHTADDVLLEVHHARLRVRVPLRVRFRYWLHRKRASPAQRALEDAHAAAIQRAFLYGDGPTYDELVTGAAPPLSPEAQARDDALRSRPRKPLPGTPLPIYETCPTCRGTGGGQYNDCPTCDGNGVI